MPVLYLICGGTRREITWNPHDDFVSERLYGTANPGGSSRAKTGGKRCRSSEEPPGERSSNVRRTHKNVRVVRRWNERLPDEVSCRKPTWTSIRLRVVKAGFNRLALSARVISVRIPRTTRWSRLIYVFVPLGRFHSSALRVELHYARARARTRFECTKHDTITRDVQVSRANVWPQTPVRVFEGLPLDFDPVPRDRRRSNGSAQRTPYRMMWFQFFPTKPIAGRHSEVCATGKQYNNDKRLWATGRRTCHRCRTSARSLLAFVMSGYDITALRPIRRMSCGDFLMSKHMAW